MHSHIAELVAGLLTNQFRTKLPIDPFALNHKKNIHIQSTEDYFLKTPTNKRELSHIPDLQDGITLVVDNDGKTIYLVLYNNEVINRMRVVFTIAHELGHIYLGHDTDGPEEEKEADLFAAELLVPRVLLWELTRRFQWLTHEMIQSTFGVSKSMAKKRLDNEYPSPKRGTKEEKLWKRFHGLLPWPNEGNITV